MNDTVRLIGYKEWYKLWNDVNKCCLTQSWEYGNAKSKTEKYKVKRFVIEDADKSAKAIVQVLIKEFYLFKFFIFAIIRINRGPLILKEDINSENYKHCYVKVLKSFLSEARKRRWLLVSIAPEIKKGIYDSAPLQKIFFIPRNNLFWGSSLLSLDVNEEEILNNTKSRWRRCLRKAIKNRITIEKLEDFKECQKLIDSSYQKLQNEKSFKGISRRLLYKLLAENESSSRWHINVYRSFRNEISNNKNNENGILVSIIHGDTCTYLLSYTNKDGRDNNASYLLFWQAILDAKDKGCRWFDLGGITNNTTTGIRHFKNGFNGQYYELIGEGFILNIF